jgi:hypothetical protein
MRNTSGSFGSTFIKRYWILITNWFMKKKPLAEILLLVTLAIVTIFAQGLFLKPPILSDQLDYFFWASRFPDSPQFPHHRTLRLGLLIPLSALIKLFGYSEAAYYTIPVFSMVVFIWGIFLVARLFFSRQIAFFSALLAVFIPNLLRYSGDLLPDIPSSALSLIAFYGLIQSGRNHQKNLFIKKPLFFILVGAILGWAYLTRESIVIIFPMILVIFFLFRIPPKNIIFLALGFLAVASIEMIYGKTVYGNPFIRFSFASPRPTAGGVSMKISKIITYLILLLSKYNAQGYVFLLFTCFFGALFYALRGGGGFN